MMQATLIFLGLIFAGSDGAYFPWANVFGVFLMYLGCAGLIRKSENSY